MISRYLQFVRNKYGADSFRYISDANVLQESSFEAIKDVISFELIENDSGFAVLYRDIRIAGILFFGFFELRKNSQENFDNMIDSIQKKGGVGEKILGPYNFSLRNSYRFSQGSTQGFTQGDFKKHLLGEYQTDPLYYECFLQDNTWKVFEKYLSAYRDRAHFSKKDILMPENMTIRQVQLNIENLTDLFVFLQDIFINAPEISHKEKEIYMKEFLHYKKETTLFFLYDGDIKIGTCAVFMQSDTIIIKNMGLLPEYQKKGLGGLLLQYVYNYYIALADIQRCCYLYMREGDMALTTFSHQNAHIYNRYATFICEIQ